MTSMEREKITRRVRGENSIFLPAQPVCLFELEIPRTCFVCPMHRDSRDVHYTVISLSWSLKSTADGCMQLRKGAGHIKDL